MKSNFLEAKNIKKIVFSGDLLRNYDARSKTPADGAINDIYHFFSQQIKSISDIEIIKETSSNPRMFNREKFFSLCKKNLNETNWVSIYSEPAIDAGVNYFKECFDGCLILFQEAGALRKYADAAQIPYIDMFISSLRFTEDLNYAMRSNIKEVYEKLITYSIPEASFYAQANLIKVYYNHHEKIKIDKNSCILCGQTSVDLSLIKNGKMYSLLDFIPEIEKLAEKYNLYYIPHPLANLNSDVEKTILSLPYIKRIQANIYQLLSSDNVKAVCALSSSVLKEAKFFNKEIYTLLHPYVNYYNMNYEIVKDNYVILTHECFSNFFWHDILSVFTEVKNCKYFNFNNNSHFIRKILNAYYGYMADDFIQSMYNINAYEKKHNTLDKNLKKLKDKLFVIQKNRLTYLLPIKSALIYNGFLFKLFGMKKHEVGLMKGQNKLSLINIKKNDTKYSNITVVLQGSTLQKFNGIRCVELSVASIRKLMPSCKIILSTWEGENIPKDLLVDKVIFNKDPGFFTRDCTENGKKNNVNRQIVSTLAGLKAVTTDYALKLRTDFILTNLNFLKNHNLYRKFDKNYRIFERRILCSLFDTRKPYGDFYNLPYHVGDLFYYGLTEDLLKLFDIPLVSKEEFTYFVDHTEIVPDTFAKNKYNAEQSIWMNCLRKSGKKVLCEYSTHINEEIANESDKFLVNNFVPYSFKGFGALPLKVGLRAENRFITYCDNYTTNEWIRLYEKLVLSDTLLSINNLSDEEELIKFATKIRKSKLPDFCKKFIFSRLRRKAKKIFD